VLKTWNKAGGRERWWKMLSSLMSRPWLEEDEYPKLMTLGCLDKTSIMKNVNRHIILEKNNQFQTILVVLGRKNC
jgi:hypothetical protein